MSGVGHRLLDLGYAAGWGLARALPEGLARAAFRSAADVAARRGGPRTTQLRRNLARVVPQAGPAELDDLVRAGLRSYARYWRETFRLPSMDHQAVYRQVDETIVGKALIDDGLARGKGVIVAMPHSGNLDIAGLWLVGHQGSFTTIVERLQPESVYQRFLAFRESLGFEILPVADGSVAPYRVMVERLRANKVVCLPADRDLSGRGVPVTFFGEQARMPSGPARLAAATGAKLLLADNAFTEDGWAVRIHTPIEVHSRADAVAATQRMADVFAADIAANPVDWHMLQPLWDADLPATPHGSRKARPSGDAAPEPEEISRGAQ